MIDTTATIETDRLLLRAPRMDNAARLAELANDFAVTRMTGRMPHPYALEDAVEWIGRAAAKDPRAETAFVIDHRDHGLVGAISLFHGDEPFQEVGYWIGRPFWGRGVASEALLALVDRAGRDGRRALVAGHFVDNPASGVVLEKAGFLYTGVVATLFSRARGEAAPTRRMIRLA